MPQDGDGKGDSDTDNYNRGGKTGIARKGATRPLWPLQVDDEGRAILPIESSQPFSPSDLRDIIRSVVIHSYRKSFILYLSLGTTMLIMSFFRESYQ
jgi:hypothetical protein